MGLDMYLIAEQYLKSYDDDDREIISKVQDIANVKKYKPNRIEYDVGYWRKQNQIHRWFVENVQDGEDDCKRVFVPMEKLEELLEKVKKALESKEPQRIFPPMEGFFFGGTDIDEYYVNGLKDTKSILENLFAWKELDRFYIYYYASW